MATFKVGQRVRKVAYANNPDWTTVVPVGAEGIVVELSHPACAEAYGVLYPAVFTKLCAAYAYQLEPLVDPRESAWADSKIAELLKPKSLPLHPSELETVRGGA